MRPHCRSCVSGRSVSVTALKRRNPLSSWDCQPPGGSTSLSSSAGRRATPNSYVDCPELVDDVVDESNGRLLVPGVDPVARGPDPAVLRRLRSDLSRRPLLAGAHRHVGALGRQRPGPARPMPREPPNINARLSSMPKSMMIQPQILIQRQIQQQPFRPPLPLGEGRGEGLRFTTAAVPSSTLRPVALHPGSQVDRVLRVQLPEAGHRKPHPQEVAAGSVVVC